MLTHQAAKPWGDRRTLAVFEGMDDVAQRPVVTADGAGPRNLALTGRAVRTDRWRNRIGCRRDGRDSFVGPTFGIVFWCCASPLVRDKSIETLTERGQGGSAPIAERRGVWPNRRPAMLADRTIPQMMKNRVAGGARWGEQHQRCGLGSPRQPVRQAPPPVRRTRRARWCVPRFPRAVPGCKTGAGRP